MTCSISIHDHEILYEFITWVHIWIHDHEEYHEIICRNSPVWIHLWIHVIQFICEFMPLNSWLWMARIHNYEIIYEFIITNSCVNSAQWREYREIMAEFSEMNSHMKSWLNSLILNYSWFSFKFLSVKENVLLIQRNHHSSFAVSSLQALRLLHGCC